MRLAISVGVGSAAFFVMALALIVLKESAENPMILVAAGMLGLAAFGGTYILDRLTESE